jgi:hypothetical protein
MNVFADIQLHGKFDKSQLVLGTFLICGCLGFNLLNKLWGIQGRHEFGWHARTSIQDRAKEAWKRTISVIANAESEGTVLRTPSLSTSVLVRDHINFHTNPQESPSSTR